MKRKAAEVARGTRGPILRGGGEQTIEVGVAKAAPAVLAPARPGVRRFVADAFGYRLTITMPDDYRDQVTGRKVSVKGKSAQFKEGYFETDDAEIIERIEKSAAFANSEIRDLDVEDAKQRVAAVESLASIVKNSPDPALRAKVLEALGIEVKEDFELPQEADETKPAA